MAFPAFLLLSVLAMLHIHTSMAIKCIGPDPEEHTKFVNRFKDAMKDVQNQQESEDVRKRFKPEFLKMLNSTGKMDCTEVARELGLDVPEPTRCISTDVGSCRKFGASFAMFSDNQADYSGIFSKSCLISAPRQKRNAVDFKSLRMGKKAMMTSKKSLAHYKAMTQDSNCDTEELGDCTRCYVCDEADYCNAGAEKVEKGTEPDRGTQKTDGTSGAMLTTAGTAPAMFLLLLAIFSGAFKWAALR